MYKWNMQGEKQTEKWSEPNWMSEPLVPPPAGYPSSRQNCATASKHGPTGSAEEVEFIGRYLLNKRENSILGTPPRVKLYSPVEVFNLSDSSDERDSVRTFYDSIHRKQGEPKTLYWKTILFFNGVNSNQYTIGARSDYAKYYVSFCNYKFLHKVVLVENCLGHPQYLCSFLIGAMAFVTYKLWQTKPSEGDPTNEGLVELLKYVLAHENSRSRKKAFLSVDTRYNRTPNSAPSPSDDSLSRRSDALTESSISIIGVSPCIKVQYRFNASENPLDPPLDRYRYDASRYCWDTERMGLHSVVFAYFDWK